MKRFISLLTILFVLVAVAPEAQAYDLEPSYTVEHVFTVADVSVEQTSLDAVISVEIDAQAVAIKTFITAFAEVPDTKSEEQAKFSNTHFEKTQNPELYENRFAKQRDRHRQNFSKKPYLTDRLLC